MGWGRFFFEVNTSELYGGCVNRAVGVWERVSVCACPECFETFEGENVGSICASIKYKKKHDEMRFYSQYIEHLKNTQMTTDSVSGFAKGYEDYLQIPLQVLTIKLIILTKLVLIHIAANG